MGSILKVVGLENEVELLREKVRTEEWNPLHLAIYSKQMALVKYYLEELKVNPRLSLLGPLSEDHNDIMAMSAIDIIVPFPSLNVQCFSLVLAVSNRDEDMLNYLLN